MVLLTVEALMLLNEDSNEPRASVAQNAPDDLAPIPGDGTAPELNSLSSAVLPLPAEAATLAALPILNKDIPLEDLFVTQSWHKPYAMALLNSNPANLPELIATAERAILDRYLELELDPVPTDELIDLGHAVEALSQLKKATGPAQ
jgi:hypothetical protein